MIPHSVFADWDGEYLTLQATDNAEAGEHRLEMKIGLQRYPKAETRDWVISVEVEADFTVDPMKLQQFLKLIAGA